MALGSPEDASCWGTWGSWAASLRLGRDRIRQGGFCPPIRLPPSPGAPFNSPPKPPSQATWHRATEETHRPSSGAGKQRQQHTAMCTHESIQRRNTLRLDEKASNGNTAPPKHGLATLRRRACTKNNRMH